ncbi:hypothetical protein [Streptomyces platensis]
MSDLKAFRVSGEHATEIPGTSVPLERNLQTLIETNMETMLGVRFLATEYSTGSRHRGRIDSLGLDENGTPVIVEYKRTRDQNVTNQALSLPGVAPGPSSRVRKPGEEEARGSCRNDRGLEQSPTRMYRRRFHLP